MQRAPVDPATSPAFHEEEEDEDVVKECNGQNVGSLKMMKSQHKDFKQWPCIENNKWPQLMLPT